MSMRTRRKSKAAAAAAAELDAESVAPSEVGTASQTRVDFSVSIPDDLDFDYLSRLLPDFSLETPSPDTVLSLYRLVVTQAVSLENALHDLEESRAENERKDVELDQALQDRESSVSSLEAQVKGFQEELTKVKQDRNALGEFGLTLRHSFFVHAPSICLCPRLLSLIQKQPRVANFNPKQFSICLVYRTRLVQT
jgi:nucleoprotein TPR